VGERNDFEMWVGARKEKNSMGRERERRLGSQSVGMLRSDGQVARGEVREKRERRSRVEQIIKKWESRFLLQIIILFSFPILKRRGER